MMVIVIFMTMRYDDAWMCAKACNAFSCSHRSSSGTPHASPSYALCVLHTVDQVHLRDLWHARREKSSAYMMGEDYLLFCLDSRLFATQISNQILIEMFLWWDSLDRDQ